MIATRPNDSLTEYDSSVMKRIETAVVIKTWVAAPLGA